MKEKNWMKLLMTVVVSFGVFVGIILLPLPFADRIVNDNVYSLLAMIKEFLGVLIVALIFKRTYTLQVKTEGLGRGLMAGMIVIVSLVFIIPTLISNVKTYGSIMTISFMDLMMSLINILLVAICEELLFRGVVQNAFHSFLGEKTQAGVRMGILFGAVVFGLAHFTNVFSAHAPFNSSLLQVIECIGMGAIFGAVYYRSKKNLWACVIIHAMSNIRALVESGMLTGSTVAENLSGYASGGDGGSSYAMRLLLVSGFTLFYLAVALFITRKKVLAPLLDK